VPEYLAAGMAVGVGMDGQTLDDDQDYLRELRLAWTLANRSGASSTSVSSLQVLNMGTAAGAAITFGRDAPLGRLAPGHLADLLLIDWRAATYPWVAPHLPATDALLRLASHRHVRHVMVHGEWVLRDGKPTRIQEEVVAEQLRANLEAQPSAALAQRAAEAAALAPYLRRFYAQWDKERTAGVGAERLNFWNVLS
jgi:cytosine/adenosine deaminase-related metal-dependent hydrolase